MIEALKNAPIVDAFSELTDVEKAQADYPAHLALLIRNFRANKGWTQQDLADFLGISQARVSKIEDADFNPKLSTLVELSIKLGFRFQIGDFTYVQASVDQKPTNYTGSSILAIHPSSFSGGTSVAAYKYR